MEAGSGIWNMSAVVKDAVMAPSLLQAGMAAGLVPLLLTPGSNYPILLVGMTCIISVFCFHLLSKSVIVLATGTLISVIHAWF